jgi:predicted  nucleic acid-binding Zn-ribbon protein
MKMPEDEVEGPMQAEPAVRSLEKEVSSATKEAEAAAMDVEELRNQRRIASASLPRVGVQPARSLAGASVDQVVENYEHIVLQGDHFKTIQKWVARMRGRTPEKVIEEYNNEGLHMIRDFDETVNQANAELFRMQEGLDSIKSQFEEVVFAAGNHQNLAKQYQLNIDILNANIAGFRNLDTKKKEELFAKYAPGLKDDRRYSSETREIRLLQALRSERNRLRLESKSVELEIAQLDTRAMQLTNEHGAKERHVEDYETRISAAENNFEPVRQYILANLVPVVPRNSGVERANKALNVSVDRLKEQVNNKRAYVEMQDNIRVDEELSWVNPLPESLAVEPCHNPVYNARVREQRAKLRSDREQSIAAMKESTYRN